MGQMLDGKWQSNDAGLKGEDGSLKRPDSAIRNFITASGKSGFKAEANRYHLYVAYACPWAHRTLIFRKLKNLEDIISVSFVHPLMLENGWEFRDDFKDELNGKKYLYEIYQMSDPNYTGRVSVPVLWDKQTQKIVSNESAEIIRMFNTEFSELVPMGHDYYPDSIEEEIDKVNDFIYDNINNGVYKAGMAESQGAYEKAFVDLFRALDTIDDRLADQEFLMGDVITEADWRLFTTLLRFDPVYYFHFKCNLRPLSDYKNLYRLFLKLLNVPGIRETINLEQTKLHYYGSHKDINPKGIVPKGPELEWESSGFIVGDAQTSPDISDDWSEGFYSTH